MSASTLFPLVRTALPASCVDHSVACHFFDDSEHSLVTAGANCLKVFRIRPQQQDASTPLLSCDVPKMRMECVCSWQLHAPVQDLAAVRLAGSSRDALLLSFLDAKLSLVEYSPETHDLRTVSLHIFEDDALRGGYTHNHFVPTIRVDPENRCAAMLVYGRKFVVLPFKRDVIGATSDSAATDESDSKASPPVLSSYTLDLKAVITNAVENIIDFQFLHGYSQPTLLILYEPLKTFAGRIAVRKDTCRLDVITLDVKERISAFIWSKEVLPFDCLQAVPVPKPIGGVLVFSTNALYHLNQGIPPYGVSLNSIGDTNLENVHRFVDGVRLSLDCAKAAFVTHDRAVVSLKGGELYVLSLLVDFGMRSVKGFHFDRAASSVLTTSLAVVESSMVVPYESFVLTTSLALIEASYLFLGSRLGNSLLLHFKEKDIGFDSSSIRGPVGVPPSKKKRVDEKQPDWLASDVGDIMDVDLEVYGSRAHDDYTVANRVASYNFEVCDSLLNLGPCSNMSMGEPAFLSDEFTAAKKADPDAEVVTTAGYGKNGALCVLQQTVRPQVVTTFELPGIQNMWTVVGKSSPELENGHAFLILSRADSTMILQTGQEINELDLDQSGFCVQAPTVFMGNLGDNKYIVQVTRDSVYLLLNDGSQLQHLQLELPSNTWVAHASCADPHLLLASDDGEELFLVTLDAAVGVPRLGVVKANLKSRSAISRLDVYRDRSGMFVTEMREKNKTRKSTSSAASAPASSQASAAAIEDEEALLYGSGSATSTASDAFFVSARTEASSEPFWKKYLRRVTPTYWAVILRENGELHILALPDFTLKYIVKNFPLGADVLVDASVPSASYPVGSSSALSESALGDSLPAPAVTEIMLVGLGQEGSRPLLLARTADHELLAYEAFPFCDGRSAGQLKIRFKKMRHNVYLRERPGKHKRDASSVPRPSMRHFADIAGYEGVFLCGPYPHWLFLTARGELRVHPMGIDGLVPSFAPFHNVNCPHGFLYFNRKSELRICVLPTHLSYDAAWPVRKVPLRATAHFVTYHLESKTYAVATSMTETTEKVWKFNGDDKELCTESRDDRFPWPSVDAFSLQLFSPVSWESIPGTKQSLNDYERCTSLKHLYLSSEGLHSGQRGYIVCSTAYCYGEDVTPRGYIRIYDVIEVIPEPGQPLTKNKMKSVYDKEQKGPITAVSAVNGYLVAAVGQKVYIFQFKNKDLFGVAFIDSQIYIHQLASLKNFILVGDAIKSVDLLLFQKDYRTLAVISRDIKPLEVYCCEFMVDNTSLAFVVSDAERNLQVLEYAPDSRDSNGGHMLVRRADFNLGQHVNAMFRIRAKITDPSVGGRVLTGWEKRHVTWFSTLDGALGFLLPIAEKTFRRFLTMSNVITQSIPHTAGLNPKACRTVRQRRRDLTNPVRSLVDGDLVFSFGHLDHVARSEVAKKMGTKVTDVLDDLAELDRMAAHF